MAEKLPWMPFYGADFFESENVRLMDPADQILYLRALWRQWRFLSLPGDLSELLTVIGAESVQTISPRLLAMFPVGRDGRRQNARLEEVRRDYMTRREIRKKAGSAGGKAKARRYQNPSKPVANPQAEGLAERSYPEPEPEPEPEGSSVPELPKTPPPAASAPPAESAAASVDRDLALQVAGGMRREDWPALQGFTRAARNPDAFLRMLVGIPQGLYGEPYDLATIGRALSEMAVAGAKGDRTVLSGFCRRIVSGDPPPRRSGAQAEPAEDEFERAGRELEEARKRREGVPRA